jgi:hypothetical protein
MGLIYHTQDLRFPDLHRYEPEYNEDGTEKHILCHGARFHVVSWDGKGAKCSEPNCEINKQRSNNRFTRRRRRSRATGC